MKRADERDVSPTAEEKDITASPFHARITSWLHEVAFPGTKHRRVSWMQMPIIMLVCSMMQDDAIVYNDDDFFASRLLFECLFVRCRSLLRWDFLYLF